MSTASLGMPEWIPYSDVYAWCMLVISILTSLNTLPQVATILKTRSTRDVSAWTYIIYGIGNVCWLIYGTMLQNLVVFISSCVPVLGSLTILIMMCVFKDTEEK
jgi:MtN3 and saliva related transmembrane protein